MPSLENFDTNPLLANMARIFARRGSATEVAILADAKAHFEHEEHDNWDGGTEIYRLVLEIPVVIYGQIEADVKEYEKKFQELAWNIIYPNISHEYLQFVSIVPIMITDQGWQDKAKAWLAGDTVSNQGRVRSDNIAPKTCDGLLFRSEPEINLYKALKSRGVSFAPLAVFIRGGETYRRIEPDFVILKDGIVMVVEVDGDTVHQETPAEAHARTTMLAHEGAAVERVRASECATEDLANTCADKLLAALAKLKSAR